MLGTFEKRSDAVVMSSGDVDYVSKRVCEWLENTSSVAENSEPRIVDADTQLSKKRKRAQEPAGTKSQTSSSRKRVLGLSESSLSQGDLFQFVGYMIN